MVPRLLSFVSSASGCLRLGALPLLLFSFALGACDSPTDENESALGEIEITVSSEGTTMVPDSLVVLLNGDVSGTMGPNGTYTIPFLPPPRSIWCLFGRNGRVAGSVRTTGEWWWSGGRPRPSLSWFGVTNTSSGMGRQPRYSSSREMMVRFLRL